MGFENPFGAALPERDRESQPPSSEKPASTKRLRELSEDFAERKQAEIQQEIEDRITDLMQPGLLIGEGQIGDVYCGRENDDMEGFCVKHKARNTAKSTYENNLQAEMKLQSDAFRILEEARAEGIAVGRVPRPWAYIKTSDGRELMTMDRMPGKTLYRIMLEKAADKMPDEHLLPGCKREDIPSVSDKDLAEMVITRFLHAETKTHKQLYTALMGKAGDPPFFPVEMAIKLRNTLRVLNGKKFFHRDLHEKNIIIADDFSDVAIIDFGSSSYGEYINLTEATEVEQMGSQLRFQRDDGILTTVSALTKKPVKKT
jgi:serine/threonine protein kinase